LPECRYAECHYDECYAKCHYGECHYDLCHYAECHYAVIMLSVIILNVIMLSVILLNVIMLNVAALFETFFISNKINVQDLEEDPTPDSTDPDSMAQEKHGGIMDNTRDQCHKTFFGVFLSRLGPVL
jgi:hypothetical protein